MVICTINLVQVLLILIFPTTSRSITSIFMPQGPFPLKFYFSTSVSHWSVFNEVIIKAIDNLITFLNNNDIIVII